jgi:DNA repair protein RecO (recombination protein O)
VTGSTEDLAYVSPKTGRAVSREAAAPYVEKLLPLPVFLSTGGLPADFEELRQGLDLTGYFLERHVFWPHNKPLPPARARLIESLQR